MLANQHFLIFPTMFCTFSKTNFNFSAKFNFSLAYAFDFEQSKYLSFGKELTSIPASSSRQRHNSAAIYYETKPMFKPNKALCTKMDYPLRHTIQSFSIPNKGYFFALLFVWLPSFPTFPTMFSKDFLPKVVRNQDCMEKGKTFKNT